MVVVIVYSSGSGVDVVIFGHSVIFAVMSLLLSLLAVVNRHCHGRGHGSCQVVTIAMSLSCLCLGIVIENRSEGDL